MRFAMKAKQGLWFAALALLAAPLLAQTIPTGYQAYHVIGNDSHVWQMFNLVAAGEGQAAFPGQAYSVVGVACSTENQVVYYDQWEDGFEANILSPVQASTMVLGDGNPSNGDARDFTSDPRVLAAGDVLFRGTVLTFNSDKDPAQTDVRRQWIPMPRVSSDVRFDGGDLLYSSGGPLTVVHYQRPNTQLIAGSCETLSLQAVNGAYAYSVPVGTNTYTRYGGNGTAGSPFKYVYLDLVAFQDGTHVYVDNKSGGTASFTLNKGQHYGSPGWIDQNGAPSVTILEGTKISTDKPLAGLIFTGGSGTWQTRFYALLPDIMHSTDFVTTAPGDNPAVNGSFPLNLYIYNPNPSSAVTVNYTDSAGTGSVSVPANSVKAYTELTGRAAGVPANSTVRLTSSSNFWGISAYDYNGNITEWGHSWLATKFLSNAYSVSWAPGTRDPAGSYHTNGCNGITPCESYNRSPIWVSALEDNTHVQVDFNNDGVFDQIDTNSDDVPEAAPLPNNTYVINAGQCLRVYDWTDYDNTGTQIYSNKPVAVAYGQDSEQGVSNDPTLDLGNTVYPLIQKWLDPVLTLDMNAAPNWVSVSAGGDVIFTLTLKAYNAGPFTGAQIYDLLPAGMTYVTGSTTVTYPGGGLSHADPAQVGSRITWGLSPDTMSADDTLTVQFTGHIGAGAAAIFHNEAHASATLGTGSTFSPMATFDVVRSSVTLSKIADKSAAAPGENVTYTITVTNTSAATDETTVVVTDPLPDNLVYVGPITSNNPAFTGTFKSAQNAVVWTAATFAHGTSATLTFVAQVLSSVPGGTVISNVAKYESTQTPCFQSVPVTTTVSGPILNFTKSGPLQAFQGDRITFDVTVTNSGNGAASNLLIVDPFPANATYAAGTMKYSLNGGAFAAITDSTSDADPGYAYADRLEFHLASLAAGSSVVFRFQSDVTGAYPNTINNQATVACASLQTRDTNLVRVTIVTTDLSASQKSVVDLNGGDVDSGDILEYTITLIESVGLISTTGVSVTDNVPAHVDTFTVVSIPAGATNSSTPAPSGSNGTGYLNISNITVPAGGSVTIVFRVSVSSGAATGDLISNSATVTNPHGTGATPSSPNLVVRQSQIASSGIKPFYLRNAGAPYTLTRAQPTNTNNRSVTLNNSSREWDFGAPGIYTTPPGNLMVRGVVQASIWLSYNQSNANVRVSLYYNQVDAGHLIGVDNFVVPNPFNTFHTYSLTATGYSQTFPAGTTFLLMVAETAGRRANVYYDMTARNSRVLLPCVNVINVDSVAGYSAAYPGGSVPSYFDPGQTAYFRAAISDPFGSSDVTGATLQLTDATGATIFTGQAMTQVADSGTSTKTYEYAYAIPSNRPRGIWTGTVTAIEGTESPSPATDLGTGTIAVRLHAPTLNSPIIAGSSSISGTSDEPIGTTITVYSNGVSIGTTTVLSGGTWTLSGVSGLVGGESITAKAGTGGSQSPPSTAVIVTPAAPVVNSPITAGATSVSGTSSAPVGSTITVYKNGSSIGTTTVQAGGTWTLSGIAPALADGNSMTATVTVGGAVSALSPSVIVSTNAADVTPTPTVNSPLLAGATSVSGTSASPTGTRIDVFVNGLFIGTTTVQAGGTWTLSSIGPLADGQAVTATATDAANNHGTSAPSPPVYVSANAGDQTAAPTILSPIYDGATIVYGTSSSPAGTIIDVYVNGIFIGQTAVLSGGAWSLSGIGPLVNLQVVTATATDLANNHGTSVFSVPVIVEPSGSGDVTSAPTVNSPIHAGATSVSGISTAAAGTRVDVFVQGHFVGSATVQADGTWALSGIPPLNDGEQVRADATDVAGGKATSSLSAPVYVSANAGDQTPTPVVTSPIYQGATSVSGTSASPAGTLIDVFVNGVYQGQTTVQAGGTWTLSGLGSFTAGQVITARATDAANNKGTSVLSAPVTVQLLAGLPPIVTSSLLAGAPQTISGSSVEAAGSTITVYVNGVSVGTATVQTDGTWSLSGQSLAAGQTVYATVQAAGKGASSNSNVVTVSSNPSSVTPPPIVTGPIGAGSTSVSGMSVANATVNVYADGVFIGTGVANGSGAWILSGVSALADGAVVNATATLAPSGTSDWSPPVIVGTIVDLMRSDLITSLGQPIAPCFTRPWAPAASSLDPIGAKHMASWGEGPSPQPAAPGSSDGDQAYVRNVHSGDADPEAAVLTDNSRPLVFYELLDNNTKTLKLSKSGGQIVFTITP